MAKVMNHSMEYLAAVLICFLTTANFFPNASAVEVAPDDSTEIEGCECGWTEWMSNPPENSASFKGDNNSFAALRGKYDFCDVPLNIECRSKNNPNTPFEFVKPDGADCDVASGLVCISRPKNKTLGIKAFYCDDYEIRVDCCYCPETSTPVNIVQLSTTISSRISDDITREVTVNATTPAPHPFGLPISIIIVIIAAVILVSGIVLCVVLTHKEKKPKFSHHYMPGDSYLQRPVSFTEVDFMRSASTSSVASSKSEASLNSSERRAFRYTELSKVKLDFIQAEQDDQPDVVVSSTKRTNHEPILRHEAEERRWLPDEYEQKKGNMKAGKKGLFSRPVPPPVPPPPPIKKSVAFPDGSKK